MADSTNSAVFWLILATSISSITSALLYLLQGCCGQFWHNVNSICFQHFARSLEIRKEYFHQTTNLLTLPRILQQLQLQSFQVIWNHDANAQTGDCVQWGWIRLPSRSYFLSFLSLCGISHYVYIPADLKSVEIVGPGDAIAVLINLSNKAASTRLSDMQLDFLRNAFGMGASWTKCDHVCTYWERRTAGAILSIACILLSRWSEFRRTMAIFCVFGTVGAIVYAFGRRLRQILVRCGWPWYRLDRNFQLPLLDSNSADPFVEFNTTEENVVTTSDLENELHSIDIHFMDPGPYRAMIFQQETEDPAPEQTVILQEETVVVPKTCSLLQAKDYYYEVVKQIEVIQVQPGEMLVQFGGESARMYAVELQPNFEQYLAERIEIPPDACLHICFITQ